MALVDNKSYSFITAWGGGTLDFQAWRTERLKNNTFEYHAFVTVNHNKPRIQSKGATFMIIRVTAPIAVNSVQEYYMGYTGLEGSPDDALSTAWTNRATLNYKRYDEVIKEFFQ